MDQYRPSGFNFLPPAVKNLLIINGLFFVITILAERMYQVDLGKVLGLFPFQSEYFKPYQLVTHFFMHANFMHLASNMFALWMFGSVIENYWGAKRMLFYYFFTAFGAALLHQGVNWYEIHQLQSQASAFFINPDIGTFSDVNISLTFINEWGVDRYLQLKDHFAAGKADPEAVTAAMNFFEQYIKLKADIPTVGASGAVFGVLLAYGMMFPNTYIYLYFAIPIKAKWFVAAYGLFELFSGFRNNPMDNVAHFAHLGGMLFGYILIKYWNRNLRNRFY